MKIRITLILLVVTFYSFGQNDNYKRWIEMAKNDITLRPEYGNVVKNAKQRESDKKFRDDILGNYKGDTIMASKKMVELGFTYLYDKGDFVTAMRRFNQANMLDSKNSDAYYGFGTIYFNFGEMNKAREQYDKGLGLNPNNSAILTDYGTTYLGDYYSATETNKTYSIELIKKANDFLSRSFKINKKDSNTIYKLSIVKMYLGECKEAQSLLKKAKKMKNPNVTESYERELKQKCR